MGLYLISLIVPKAVSLIRRKYGSSLIKVEKPRIKQIRYLLQLVFSFYVLCGGYRLYMFYQHFMMGTSYVNRPNIVDSFLPIGGLLGLRLWVEKGNIHSVQPVLYVLIVLVFFLGFIGVAQLTGNWESQISYDIYKEIVPLADKFTH